MSEPRKTVWIVECGEQCGGGSVEAVFDHRPPDSRILECAEPCFGGGWILSGTNEWESGCDYLKITEFPVVSNG